MMSRVTKPGRMARRAAARHNPVSAMQNTGSRTPATSEITVEIDVGELGSRAHAARRRGRRARRKSARIARRRMLGQFLSSRFRGAPPQRRTTSIARSASRRSRSATNSAIPYVAAVRRRRCDRLARSRPAGPRAHVRASAAARLRAALRRARVDVEQAHLADDEFNQVVFSDPNGQAVLCSRRGRSRQANGIGRTSRPAAGSSSTASRPTRSRVARVLGAAGSRGRRWAVPA